MKVRQEAVKHHIDSALKAVDLDNDRRAIEKQPAGGGAGQ